MPRKARARIALTFFGEALCRDNIFKINNGVQAIDRAGFLCEGGSRPFHEVR